MVDSFARLLDELCAGRTNVQLAASVRARGGDVGHAYIAQLRKGHKDNPTRQTIEDLAAVLGVHPAYFVGGRRDLGEGERPGWRADALRNLGAFSPEAVSAAISASGRHGPISASYLRELLSGASDNPRLKHLLGLAEYFGVEPAYFFDDQLAAVVSELRELGVVEFTTRLAERAADLHPETRRATLRAIADALGAPADETWRWE